MLRKLAATLSTALLIGLGLLIAPTAASADDGFYCDADQVCYLTISSAPTDPPYAPDENGWSPGATECLGKTDVANIDAEQMSPDQVRVLVNEGGQNDWYVTMDCGNDYYYWSNDRQCYMSLAEGRWPDRPAGFSADAGYYECGRPYYISGANGFNFPFWSETVPPGLRVLTPAVAAARLISTFQLQGIEIGMAPTVNPAWGHRRSYVGVPVWLWVNNPQPLTWGPYTETATLGGQTITATAQVTSVRWSMGDGSDVVCGNTGTPYSLGYGLSDSPTCGHRYQSMSSAQPGDRYTVTATSQWVVTWSAVSGATGTVNLTTASVVDLEVNEMQTVIVGTGSDDNQGP